MGIVTNSTAMERKGSLAQPFRVHTRHPNVDGLGLHVQAVFGHPWSVRAEEFVSPWCTISADDVDLAARMAHGYRQFLKKVEESRIEMTNVPSPMVAQEIIQFSQGTGDVILSLAIDNVNSLASMRLEKQQAICLHLFYSRGSAEGKGGKNKEEER
jgi:hypothetical protein